MAEVLIDTKFWNKVFKILKPATVVAVKKNKGASKSHLIPSNGSETLNKVNNIKGFFYRYMNRYSGMKMFPYYSGKRRLLQVKAHAWERGLTDSRIKEIERAIVQVAVSESVLPESALYSGKPVIRRSKQPEKSTSSFGFVYFVRNGDIYKLGITDNLLRRTKELNPDEILNAVRCSNYQAIEKKMHVHFKNRRIPQTEYFRLDVAEVEEAHSLMTDLADFKGC